jgi:hypothetical protein
MDWLASCRLHRRMSYHRRTRRVVLLVVVLVLSGPPLVFEAFYGLLLSGVPTPVLPKSDAPELLHKTLWIATGEQVDDRVEWLWLGNMEWWRTPLHAHGARAASEVARLWLDRQPLPPSNLLWQALVETSVTVWLTRHATAVQLQHALAEWEPFGRGAVGVSAASAAYFGRTQRSLRIQQMALLAEFLEYSPPPSFCPPDGVLTRRALLLGQMVGAQLISTREGEAAALTPLDVVAWESCGQAPQRKRLAGGLRLERSSGE